MKTYDEAKTGAVEFARRLRRDSTDAETRLWRALRSKLPQYKWRRQMPVGPYFADFACLAEKLVIELDGGQHATAADYDDRRSEFLEAQGYRILRFWNNDVLTNTDGLMETIAESLSLGRGREQRELRKGEVDDLYAISTSPSHSFAAGPSLSQGRGVQKLAVTLGSLAGGLIVLDLIGFIATAYFSTELLQYAQRAGVAGMLPR